MNALQLFCCFPVGCINHRPEPVLSNVVGPLQLPVAFSNAHVQRLYSEEWGLKVVRRSRADPPSVALRQVDKSINPPHGCPLNSHEGWLMKIEGFEPTPEIQQVTDDADGIPVTGPVTYFSQPKT